MKLAYPIVLTPAETGYSVYVPDLDINTEGDSLADAIAMASDAIGLWGITKQDMGGEIPAPSETLPACQSGETAAYALVVTILFAIFFRYKYDPAAARINK